MAYWTRTLKMVDREQHGVWARREKEITTWETQRTSFCNDTPSLWSFFCPDQKSYAMTCPTWHRIFMILNVSSPLPNFNHQIHFLNGENWMKVATTCSSKAREDRPIICPIHIIYGGDVSSVQQQYPFEEWQCHCQLPLCSMSIEITRLHPIVSRLQLA